MGRSRRCKMTKVRRFGADFVDYVEVKRIARLVGNSQKVQHAVARTTQSHVASKCVADRLFVDNIPCLDILVDKVHNCHTRVLGKCNSCAGYGRYSSVARERDTYRLT